MANLIIYEKTLEMIEYGTIALRQFPRHEKFVLAAMIRQQMYEVLTLIVEANKRRQHRESAMMKLDIAHETLRHLVDLSHRRLKYLDYKKYSLWMERINEVGKLLGGWIRSSHAGKKGAQTAKHV